MEHRFPGDAADRLLGNEQWASTVVSPQTGGLRGQGLFNHHVSPEHTFTSNLQYMISRRIHLHIL